MASQSDQRSDRAISIISNVYIFNTQRKQNGEPVQANSARQQPGPAAKKQAGHTSQPQPATDRFVPAEKATTQIYKLNRYIDDNRSSVELVKTVKDALGEIDSVLKEMRDLSEQASGEKMSPFERILAEKAIDNYIAQVDRIAGETELKAAQLLGSPPPDPNTFMF